MPIEHFEGRLPSKITADDIRQLCDSATPEDEWIDFKSHPYGPWGARLLGLAEGTLDDDRPETECKLDYLGDVAAFANAGGGYIVLGVEDKDHCAVAPSPLPEPSRLIDSMSKLAQEWIAPRIDDLAFGRIRMGVDQFVVVIRVPGGRPTLRMVRFAEQTLFKRRIGRDNRAMTYSDIRDAFQSDEVLTRLDRIEAYQMGIMKIAEGAVDRSLPIDASALEATTSAQLLDLMERRLREQENEGE